MPLIKSGSREAVSRNIAEMRSAGHPQAQSVAAALSNARRYGAHFATGGFTPPFAERYAARQLMHEGFLHSPVPGRTDKLPITVGGGAYVLPADHVAALGQGNSLAGANIVNKMFKMPYGTSPTALKGSGARVPHLNLRPPGHQPQATPGAMPKIKRGGTAAGQGKPIPIIAAGGEIVIPPDKIIAKFGDLDRGHKTLDKWVLDTRQQHIKTLRKLKPPKKD